MKVTFDELIRDFDTYISITDDLLKDFRNSKKSEIYYNIDFSLLFEYIWGSSPSAIPPFKPYGRITENLVQAKKSNQKFQFVFTGPSFWELLDSIVHETDRIVSYEFGAKSQQKDIQNIMKGMNDFSNFEKVLIDSGVATNQLELLKERGFAEQIRRPINRALALIDKGKILKGIGEVVSFSTNIAGSYKNLYNELLETMLHKRIDDRDYDAKRFHFGVDSANIIATNALNATNQEIQLFFVTQPKLKRNYCPDYGRNPLVPFYWVSVVQLKENGIIDSEEHFLTRMKERAIEIKKELFRAQAFDNVSKFLEEDVLDFHRRFLKPLKDTKSSISKKEELDDNIKFQELISDPDKLKKRFREAKEELVEGARNLAILKEDLLGDAFCEMMVMQEDPIVKKIRKTLKI
jgi:hypothetical protein